MTRNITRKRKKPWNSRLFSWRWREL